MFDLGDFGLARVACLADIAKWGMAAMNPLLDKDQPFLWVILISLFSWTFNNYVDSLRIDTTLYVTHETILTATCRTDTFTFENLSSKNGISNLSVAITAKDVPRRELQACGQDLFHAQCLAFEPNTSVATPGLVSLPVNFPLIYPERSCSIALNVPKDFPPLEFLMLQTTPTAPATGQAVDQSMHIASNQMRIVTQPSIEIWIIRNARFIYFVVMLLTLALMIIWLFIAILKSMLGAAKPAKPIPTPTLGEAP